MLKGKRGLAKKELAEIILALVVALSIFGPFIKGTDVAAATIDVEKCRINTVFASFEAGWDMKVFKVEATNPFYLDCPKRYAYVSNDNIKVGKINTKLAKLEDDEEELRKRQLKDFILSEMTKCWKSFGGASDTVYSASPGAGENEIDTGDTACFSCSEVFFDKDFNRIDENKEPEPLTISKSDFYEYANSKNMIIGDQSYVEFLTGGNAPDELPAFGEGDKIELKAGEQWSTVFMIKGIATGWFDDKFNWLPFVDIRIPPVNGGVVDCYVVGDDGNFANIDKRLEYSIGCKATDPPTIKGFVFGKVASGYYTFFGKEVSWNTGNTVRFPMTVRFIPTKEVFGEGKDKCKRLY